MVFQTSLRISSLWSRCAQGPARDFFFHSQRTVKYLEVCIARCFFDANELQSFWMEEGPTKKKTKHYSFIHMESSPKWLYLSLADYKKKISVSFIQLTVRCIPLKDVLHSVSTLDCNTCISCRTWKHAKPEKKLLFLHRMAFKNVGAFIFVVFKLGQWSKVILYTSSLNIHADMFGGYFSSSKQEKREKTQSFRLRMKYIQLL